MSSGNGGQVFAALILDAVFGEPPEAVHPTVLMGRTISAYETAVLTLKNPAHRRIAGISLALFLPSLVFVSTREVSGAIPRGLRSSVGAALVFTTLSMRGLARAAEGVERELTDGRLEAARTQVGRFVGRDTDGLTETEVSRAAVESVAENTSDGVVAPMLYGLLFGAPGALAYKAVNTLDSMVGHPEVPYREIGWASARLDDLANILPSRITALSVAAVSGRPIDTLRITYRYGPLTTSPNAGVAEAAFAGALGIRLGGTNSYNGVPRRGPVLGEGRHPVPDDVRLAVTLMRRCCVLLGILAFLAGQLRRG